MRAGAAFPMLGNINLTQTASSACVLKVWSSKKAANCVKGLSPFCRTSHAGRTCRAITIKLRHLSACYEEASKAHFKTER